MMDVTVSIFGIDGDRPSIPAVFPDARDCSRCCLQTHTSAERGGELIDDPHEFLPCGGLHEDITVLPYIDVLGQYDQSAAMCAASMEASTGRRTPQAC
ncbi:hypothetical protein AB0I54_12030 [Streptomyces sp. NPDC050625]|uniref:hypothetical protein n=1 Tax=Streptomyces sp. NPDC050625 TaxID=3154629 RepID=UPI00341626CA